MKKNRVWKKEIRGEIKEERSSKREVEYEKEKIKIKV